jgi:predicted protein tyrosine phosphatase
MQYVIMSRIDASEATKVEIAPNTAIISITDCGDGKNTFNKAVWLKAVLEIQFDDVDEGGLNCITTSQAEEIADFVLGIRKKIERIIVHCEFGQSRSAGIAAAICRYFENHDDSIFINRRYYPNLTCYRYVLSALKERGCMLRRVFSKLKYKPKYTSNAENRPPFEEGD